MLDRSAHGCRPSFDLLVDRHGDALLRYLQHCAPARDEVDDLFQETFVSAWSHASAFQGGDNARPWLVAIARNHIRKRYRQERSGSHETQSLGTLGHEAGWGASEDDRIQRIDAHDLVETGLARLTEEEREVIVLRDLEGLDNEAVAALMELSIAAVKSRVHRARLRLMAAMRQELFDAR